MKPLSFKRHRFPAEVIRHAVWLYLRFNLSFRDVEELMAQRGIDVSYETIWCWTIKFGPLIARRLKKRRVPPTGRWHAEAALKLTSHLAICSTFNIQRQQTQAFGTHADIVAALATF